MNVSTIANAKRQLKPERKIKEFRKTELPNCPKRKNEQVCTYI
jgi:hypothetical protein